MFDKKCPIIDCAMCINKYLKFWGIKLFYFPEKFGTIYNVKNYNKSSANDLA